MLTFYKVKLYCYALVLVTYCIVALLLLIILAVLSRYGYEQRERLCLGRIHKTLIKSISD